VLEGKISDESPLGRSLVGRKAGDTVEVTLGSADVTYTVKEVRFE